jgi:hypothetical protein
MDIMANNFSGGRSRSTQREPPTMGKQLVKLYHLRLRVECTLFCNLQSWVAEILLKVELNSKNQNQSI